jgi:GYF domain 2/RDD family
MRWYVRRGEREIGPLGEGALRALVGTGQITPETQLWREGLPGWTAASALTGILGPRAAPLSPALRPAVAAATDSTAAAAASRKDDTTLELATPWRRYWARSLDVTLGTFLVAVLVSAVRPSLLTRWPADTGGRWLVLLLLLPCALTMDALIHWALGNTAGKALAGIQALAEGGGRRLGPAAYLGRNFGLYVFGLGLGLPLISLIALAVSYRRAAAEASPWDRLAGSRVYALDGARPRTWIVAGVYLVGVVTLVALGMHAQRNSSRYTAARTPAPILQQELTQAANSINASVPRMIDRITRLDGARAGPGPLFTYDYSLTNLRVAQLSPTALETLRWRLSAHVRQAVCRGTALKPMLRIGATVRFHYRDRTGQELATVAVSSADCAG